MARALRDKLIAPLKHSPWLVVLGAVVIQALAMVGIV